MISAGKLLQCCRFSGRFILPVSLAFFVNSLVFAAENGADSPPINTHTRTLAASCAACHGSNGNSVAITPSLAGLEADYFTTQMLAFKQGTRNSTVMHQHAAGLTDLEIEQLAHFFAEQETPSQKKGAMSQLAPAQAYKNDTP